LDRRLSGYQNPYGRREEEENLAVQLGTSRHTGSSPIAYGTHTDLHIHRRENHHLFNDAVTSSDSAASDDRIIGNNELEN
jgi:hypothetical protein